VTIDNELFNGNGNGGRGGAHQRGRPSPGALLRARLHEGAAVSVGGVYDGLSTLVAERFGFGALWASGLGIAAAHGVPDASILTMTEVRDAVRVIARTSALPVIADCDTGFGEVRNLRRAVRDFEHAGAAGICIEDKLFPKRNSFLPGQQLADPHEFAGRVAAAKSSQDGEDFVIVARLESFIAGAGLDDALRRAALYAEAGADALVVHSKSTTADEVLAFAEVWRGGGRPVPLIAIPTTYHATTLHELEAGGFSMVIYANQAVRAAVQAMEAALTDLVEQGTSAPIEERLAPVRRIFELTGEAGVDRHDAEHEAMVERLRRAEDAESRIRASAQPAGRPAS